MTKSVICRYNFVCTSHAPEACRRTSEDEKGSAWAFKELLGMIHSATILKKRFLTKSAWRLFSASDDFCLISAKCYAMKTILQTQTHPLMIIKPSSDTAMKFNCRKNQFWYIFCKVEQPSHLTPCKLSRSQNKDFFQKVLKQQKIAQNGREKIPENRWATHFPKLIELSSYDT